jgi:hypothetical protein
LLVCLGKQGTKTQTTTVYYNLTSSLGALVAKIFCSIGFLNSSFIIRHSSFYRSSASLLQGQIRNNQSGHGLDNRHSPGHNTGIMAAFGLQGYLLALKIDRCLGFTDGRRRFKGHPK